eukprot:353188-Chlamydomonas_euryale.AAC.3
MPYSTHMLTSSIPGCSSAPHLACPDPTFSACRSAGMRPCMAASRPAVGNRRPVLRCRAEEGGKSGTNRGEQRGKPECGHWEAGCEHEESGVDVARAGDKEGVSMGSLP